MTARCVKIVDGEVCNAPAVAIPVLLLRPKFYMGEPIRARIPVTVCEAHKPPDAEDLLTDETWARLVDAVAGAGKMRPDREATGLDFDLID